MSIIRRIKKNLDHQMINDYYNVGVNYYVNNLLSGINNKDYNNFKVNKKYTNYYTKKYFALQTIICMLDFIQNNEKSYINFNNLTLTDGTSGVGGDGINFCKNFKHVNLFEINEDALKMLNENVRNHCYLGNVKIYNKSYTDNWKDISQNVIFLDPPWGDKEYKYKSNVNLTFDNQDFFLFINKIIKYTNIRGEHICNYIFLKIPLNTNINNFKHKDKSLLYVIYNNNNIPVYYILCIQVESINKEKSKRKSKRKSKKADK